MLEDDIASVSFTFISIDSLLVYKNKYYLHIYLDNSSCKIVKKTNDRLSWRKSFGRLSITNIVLREDRNKQRSWSCQK